MKEGEIKKICGVKHIVLKCNVCGQLVCVQKLMNTNRGKDQKLNFVCEECYNLNQIESHGVPRFPVDIKQLYESIS